MAVNQDFKKSTVSTTNHTQNYDLPLWAGEDTTSWLTQMNDAMNKIDDGMVDAKSKALEVVGIAADAKKLADETKAESAASAKIVAGYNDRLTAAEEKIVEHTQDITNLNTRSDQFDVELHSVQEVQKKTTADLATLAAKVDTNKSDADTKISANTEAIARTDANVATVSGKVIALETEVGEVSSATQTNTNAISAINTTIEGIKAKDTEQDGKIATNTTEISSLDGRVTALEEGGGGSGITKTYIVTGTYNVYGQNQSLKLTITNSTTLKIERTKEGFYLFDVDSRPGSAITGTATTYKAILLELPIAIATDFPEFAGASFASYSIGTGYVNYSGDLVAAVIASISFTKEKVILGIKHDGEGWGSASLTVSCSMNGLFRK